MTKMTLESVAKEMAHWRTTRIKRSSIPEKLKEKILTLASRYPISEITKALNIHTRHLRLQAKVSVKKSSPSKPNFIRIPPPTLLAEENKITCSFKRTDGVTLDCSIEKSDFTELLEGFLCSR